MPPNVVDTEGDLVGKAEVGMARPAPVQQPAEYYKLKIFQSSMNCLVHILIGATVFVSLMFSFRNGLPIGPTPVHIVLCVIGYQLLMAEAILALSASNGWSANMKVMHKRRVHWVLQVMGSGLAIAGSFIKTLDKNVNWNTLHGQFALVALVFTVVSLVNGLASMYTQELKRCVPGILSKLTHICFGIIAFAAASISLIYGFDKRNFRIWASEPATNALIAFTSAFTFIIIIDPFITFYRKTKGIFSR